MTRSRIGLFAIAGAMLTCTGAVQAGNIPVLLDEDNQGKGNKGFEYRPVDASGFLADFVLTAMSSIDDTRPFDPWAAGLVGTIYVEKDAKGTGVQTHENKGSKLISGGGGHKDEQVVFTFDDATESSSIQLGLTDFNVGNGLDDDDDPVLFILFSDQHVQVLTELDYLDAFQSTGSKVGYIDFAPLDLDGDSIDSLWIRETNGHLGVNGLAYSAAVVPLPPAACIGIAGLGMVGVARRRKRA